MPDARPRQPACAAATSLPWALQNSTGRQSAVNTASTLPAIEVTDASGQALYGKAGTIVGSSLEGSNTDIADEFTKLIVTQQAYSANTKVITTANTVVQDLLNVLR